MNKSRLRVSILLTVVAFILIGALMIARVQYPEFFDNNLRHYTSALRIDLNDHPDFVTSPTVNLSGRVSHAASIDVSRDGVSLRKVFASDGDFSTEIELKPGENQIKFSARRFESDQPDDEKIATVIWQPKNPPAPTLNLLPSTTNLPVVIITGTTFSVARVEIIITH